MLLLVLVLAAVLVLLVVLGGLFASRNGEPSRPHAPEDDVRVTACEVDGTTRWPHADLAITNNSSKTSDYLVSVEFVDPAGTRVAEANASAQNLASGQLFRTRAQALTQVGPDVTCRVTDVTRFASQ